MKAAAVSRDTRVREHTKANRLATEGDMRFAVLGLLLPAVLGCAGKNVVAGEEKTKAQQLAAAVPSWCATTCARLQACPAPPCDCVDDSCSCTSPAGNDCPAQCLDAMARFTTGADACAAVGELFRQ